MTMKRVLLSTAIGFVFVVGLTGIRLTFYFTKVLPGPVYYALKVPMLLPYKGLELFFARSEINRFTSSHPGAIASFDLLSNGIIYSSLVLLILSAIGRYKRKPATLSAEPPPPPEF